MYLDSSDIFFRKNTNYLLNYKTKKLLQTLRRLTRSSKATGKKIAIEEKIMRLF